MKHVTILINDHLLTYAYWHDTRLRVYQSWDLGDYMKGLYLYNPTMIGHYIDTCRKTNNIPQGITTWLALEGDCIHERICTASTSSSPDYVWNTQRLTCLAPELYYQVGIKPALIVQYLIFCHTQAINLVHIGTAMSARCHTMIKSDQTVTTMQSLQELIKKHITTYDICQIETDVPLPQEPEAKKELVSSYGLYLMTQSYEK